MPNVLSGRFRTGRPEPYARALSELSPGRPEPSPNFRARSVHTVASAIMQFRRNVFEYSTKKTPPNTSVCKVNVNRLLAQRFRMSFFAIII